jgi:hypothetical protein
VDISGDQAAHGKYRAVPSISSHTVPHVTSRFKKGTLTFGPVGRISWTLVIVILPIFTAVAGGIGGIMFTGLWCTTIARMALKDIWKRDSIYVPVPRHSPEQSLTTYDGQAIPTLSQYVASQTPPPPPS